ncbi:MAG: hypothetical protein U5N58_06670 [Actinomycetota bacterium]|nr:hypothetical protein [Actinomycetota bacterium]
MEATGNETADIEIVITNTQDTPQYPDIVVSKVVDVADDTTLFLITITEPGGAITHDGNISEVTP